jgi:hypothetical protein
MPGERPVHENRAHVEAVEVHVLVRQRRQPTTPIGRETGWLYTSREPGGNHLPLLGTDGGLILGIEEVFFEIASHSIRTASYIASAVDTTEDKILALRIHRTPQATTIHGLLVL